MWEWGCLVNGTGRCEKLRGVGGKWCVEEEGKDVGKVS